MNDLEPAARPPTWRRLILAIALVVVALIAVGFLASLFDSGSLGERQQFEAYLDNTDPNWRLADLEKAREEVPPGENNAAVIITSRRLIPRGWTSEAFNQNFPHGLPSNQRFTDIQVGMIRAELNVVDVALEQARKLENMPRGRHRFEWAFNPIATLMPDQQDSRTVAAMLQYDALLLAHEGDIDGAMRSCRACLNTARSMGDEATLISQLIRYACLAMACNATERTLFHGQVSSSELVKLQELLALEEQSPSFRQGLRGERAATYDIMLKVRDGRIPAREIIALEGHSGLTVWQHILGVRVGPREPTLHLKRMTKVIEATKKSDAEQLRAESEFEADVKSVATELAMTKILTPAITKVAQTHRRTKAQLRCMMALIAVERYRLKHGSWPASLEIMVPSFLKEVPTDPFDGKPIRFKRMDDGVAVYSVGFDGVDDGGNINRNQPLVAGVDQGYRLWDLPPRLGERLPQPEEEP